MCGRFICRQEIETYAELFGAAYPQDMSITPNYNVAPTQLIIVARNTATGSDIDTDTRPERELASLRWGLVPAWSAGPDSRFTMINARSETVAEKPAYRNAAKRRRCLIAADGFYEWQRQGKTKIPYFIGLMDQRPLAFAGLWERWEAKDGSKVIESCTLITTPANEKVSEIHQRMPVILAEQDYDKWLDHSRWPAQLLRAYPAEQMITYRVSSLVNNARNNEASLLDPLQPDVFNSMS